jgi:hypothetical protein
MGAKLTQRSNRSSRFWRSVIGLVAAYALAFQGILIGFSGAQLAATPYDHAAAGFELCLNGTQDGIQDESGPPGTPAIPQHVDHCVFCFAGVHHCALDATSQSHAGYDNFGHGSALTGATRSRPSYASDYSIARPRGPPISA